MTENRRMIILIAGPYRSGTNGDPARIAANLAALEAYALPIYRAGHIPMIGEWVALPLIRAAESTGNGSAEDFLYPVANRLIERCDAVLRVPGDSQGAEQDVRLATERGLPVYYTIDDIPCGGGGL